MRLRTISVMLESTKKNRKIHSLHRRTSDRTPRVASLEPFPYIQPPGSHPLMPPHESPPLSRRRFLRKSTSGVILLAAARFIPGASASAESAGEIPGPLRFFSANEYRVLQVASRRLIGPAPPEFPQGSGIDVALRADTFLSEEDPEIQDQFHLLLTLFSSALFAFLFDFRFRRFLDMPPDDQDSYLMDWMTSGIEIRRKGFIALKRLCLSMYYTDSRSWPEIRYEGMFLPEERP
jgi:hypothetical protein